MFKKIVSIMILLSVLFIMMSGVNAATYSISNSTDVDDISKMINGKTPIKNGNYIEDGDIVKFKPGIYKNLKLEINKKITISSYKSKNKVNFIGNNSGVAITLKSNQVKLSGLIIRNYGTGIYGKTKQSLINKIIFYKNNMVEIKGDNNKLTNNRIMKTYTFLVQGKNNKLYYNKFTNSGLIIKGSKNSIQKNSLKNNNYLIEVIGNQNLIKSNKIHNSKNDAIGITKGKNNKIYTNKITKSTNGISGSKSINIYYKNKISHCKTGILILNKKDKTIENKFHKNTKNTKIQKYIPNPYK